MNAPKFLRRHALRPFWRVKDKIVYVLTSEEISLLPLNTKLLNTNGTRARLGFDRLDIDESKAYTNYGVFPELSIE